MAFSIRGLNLLGGPNEQRLPERKIQLRRSSKSLLAALGLFLLALATFILTISAIFRTR